MSGAMNRSIKRVGGVIGAQCSVKLRSFHDNLLKNLFRAGRSRKKVGVEVVQGSKYTNENIVRTS